MLLVLFIQIFNLFITNAASVPDVHDQRQSGISNIRIGLKDAVFVAIADELGDYDYNYDYSDLTIKPEVSLTTSKPSTPRPTQVLPLSTSTTQNGSLVLHVENNTLEFVGVKPGNESLATEKPAVIHSYSGHSPSEEHQIPVTVVEETKEKTKLLPVKTLEKNYVSSSLVRGKNTSAGHQEEIPKLRHCSQGFFLDSQNRCRKIRRPLRERPQARAL